MATGTDASAAPRDSAAVILVRDAGSADGLEVLLVRRHRRATFMSSAYVFPGGVAEPGESDREAAARELAEETGVRLARADDLHYFAHWITPSIEPRRYSARFFVAALPPDQELRLEPGEIEDAVWATPDGALARSAELRLPPPQIRTLMEMGPSTREGLPALLALCAEREAAAHAILPRAAQAQGGLTLLLPWDPDYESAGQGAALSLPAGHPLAVGPSRFVLEDSAWKHIDAPTSARAG